MVGSTHRFLAILLACLSADFASEESAALRCRACDSTAALELLVGRVALGVSLAVPGDRALPVVEAAVDAERVELGRRGGLEAVRGAA